ncbi:retrovirus-related pol polyprotein from transposon TNT 1-94 [Tanacetum coccineum]
MSQSTKKLEKYHDPLALVAHTGSSSRNTSSYYVTHPTSVVDYEDEYQQDDVHTNSEDPLTSAMLNQAIIQGDRVNIQSKNSGNAGRNNRRAYVQEEIIEGSNAPNETGNVQRTLRTSSSGNTSTVQCYNCSGKGHYARNLSAEQKYFPSSFIPSDKNSNATPSIPASMPNNSLHAEIEQLKKKSIKIQEGLQARIKILEKDVQRCEKQSVDFELKLQHEKEKHKWDSSFKNKNTNPLDYSWISKMEKLEDENVSLDFTMQSLIKERDNVKLEYQKLFNSIKKTRSQTQTEMDELIAHVSEKTYAYGAIRVENQNLLFTISELKTRLANVEKGKSVNTKFDKTNGSQPLLCVTPLHKHVIQKKMDVQKSEENHVVSKPVTLQTSPAKQSGVNSNKNVIAPGMYKVVTTHESQTNEAKHDLSSTGMNAASSVRRPMNRDSHVKNSVLANSKKPTKKVAVYVRKNKQQVVQIVLWIVDSGCSKHITGDRSLLKNFIEKFMGTVRFRNDTFAAIIGYEEYDYSIKEDLDNLSGLLFEEYIGGDRLMNQPAIVVHFDGNSQFVSYNPPSREEIESSTMALESSNVQKFHQVQPSTHIWTKDHPLNQVIGDPSKPVMNSPMANTDSEWNCSYTTRRIRNVSASNGSGIIDPTLFTRHLGEDILLVQVYVDDIIFGSTNPDFSKRFANLMKNNFEISMMGELKFFLGLQVHQSPSGIFISQSQYVIELLKKHGLDECVLMSTPMATERLDADLHGTPTDQTTYRRMIGGLMYLIASRPDIAFATFLCARYQACPTVKHLKEVKRIFRYLRQSYNMGLWYLKDSGFELIAYSDTDHAGL